MTEMKNRGVHDALVAYVDGLKGFPQAIQTVFPPAQVQLCIVHLARGDGLERPAGPDDEGNKSDGSRDFLRDALPGFDRTLDPAVPT